MKKYLLAVAFSLVLLTMVSGCDLVRASLGKPTSTDLAALRQAKALREQAFRDSVAAAEAERVRLETERAATEAIDTTAVRRYYAVAGAFKEETGARAYVDQLRESGFKVRTFDFKSGLKVVCVDGNDTLEVVRRDLAALKRLGIAPSDPWIYNSNQKLHR